MSRPMDNYDDISIAEIVFYSFFLCGGIFLSIRHGFAKSTGWRYTIVLSLARLIGSALRLASISSPTNENLYIGWLTTNSVGLGPLVLIVLGLASRVFDSIARNGKTVLNPLFQRAIELLMLVAMILLIVGGTEANYVVGAGGTPKVTYPALSQAGMALMIVVMVLVIVEVLLAGLNYSRISQGERRVFAAIVVSLPFIIVRLVYSAVLIYGHVSSTAWLYLGTSVIMEILVVFICEAVGFTLAKVEPMPKQEIDQEMQAAGYQQSGYQQTGYQAGNQTQGGAQPKKSGFRYPRHGLIGLLIRQFRKD